MWLLHVRPSVRAPHQRGAVCGRRGRAERYSSSFIRRTDSRAATEVTETTNDQEPFELQTGPISRLLSLFSFLTSSLQEMQSKVGKLWERHRKQEPSPGLLDSCEEGCHLFTQVLDLLRDLFNVTILTYKLHLTRLNLQHIFKIFASLHAHPRVPSPQVLGDCGYYVCFLIFGGNLNQHHASF